jgi:hypothetical protein
VFRDDVGAIGARGKRWTAVAGGEAGKNGRAIPPPVAVGTEDETAQAHACEKRAQTGNAGRATMFHGKRNTPAGVHRPAAPGWTATPLSGAEAERLEGVFKSVELYALDHHDTLCRFLSVFDMVEAGDYEWPNKYATVSRLAG